MFEPHKPPKVEDFPRKQRTGNVLSKADIRAITNCWKGEANAHEQRIALEAAIYSIGLADELTYIPGGPEAERASAFAAGRRFVGQQLRKYAAYGSEYLVDKTPQE